MNHSHVNFRFKTMCTGPGPGPGFSAELPRLIRPSRRTCIAFFACFRAPISPLGRRGIRKALSGAERARRRACLGEESHIHDKHTRITRTQDGRLAKCVFWREGRTFRVFGETSFGSPEGNCVDFYGRIDPDRGTRTVPIRPAESRTRKTDIYAVMSMNQCYFTHTRYSF